MAIFTIDLFRIVFEEFLKISPDLVSKYSTIQDQLLYLFLIPHAILLLFIFTFGYWFVGNAHKGLRLIISLVAYIYLIWAGWYGTFVIPIVNAFLPMLIISWFLFFIFSRVFHPLNLGGASGVIKGASDVVKGSIAEGKAKEKVAKEMELIARRIRELEAERTRLERMGGQDRRLAEVEYQIGKLRDLERAKSLEL